MTINHFNAFYTPYLRSLKVTHIYRNQFKHNKYWFNIFYCIVFFSIIPCVLYAAYSKHYFLSLIPYGIFVLFLGCIDNIALKNCIKIYRAKYNNKFLTLSQFDQFKYYLWREGLEYIHLTFSIEKALHYLEIELDKFKKEKTMPPEYLLILSGITLIAFWKIFDDIHIAQKYKIFLDIAIFYISYRFVEFKIYLLPDKQKKLQIFKEYLLRLKSEIL